MMDKQVPAGLLVVAVIFAVAALIALALKPETVQVLRVDQAFTFQPGEHDLKDYTCKETQWRKSYDRGIELTLYCTLNK